MTDAPAPARRQSDSQASITATTATAGAAAGGGCIVLWGLQCLQAGHVVMPSNETALVLAATVAPLIHLIGRIVMHQLGRFAGQNGGTAS